MRSKTVVTLRPATSVTGTPRCSTEPSPVASVNAGRSTTLVAPAPAVASVTDSAGRTPCRSRFHFPSSCSL
ncbi:hypothetical protein AVL61_06880 [Kocuria rosea subsp. polaris]|uniref:Uncharacterized protein n=1 Tax=Kocuria rosea subsp. polaris TaxID=136273 RepID=A0A0W8I2W6_KOCRO|nr:hypothetical protein AVL61_06880 [Kocuria polaris]